MILKSNLLIITLEMIIKVKRHKNKLIMKEMVRKGIRKRQMETKKLLKEMDRQPKEMGRQPKEMDKFPRKMEERPRMRDNKRIQMMAKK